MEKVRSIDRRPPGVWEYTPSLHDRAIKDILGYIPKGNIYFLTRDESDLLKSSRIVGDETSTYGDISARAISNKTREGNTELNFIERKIRRQLESPAVIVFAGAEENVITVAHEMTHLKHFEDIKKEVYTMMKLKQNLFRWLYF